MDQGGVGVSPASSRVVAHIRWPDARTFDPLRCRVRHEEGRVRNGEHGRAAIHGWVVEKLGVDWRNKPCDLV